MSKQQRFKKKFLAKNKNERTDKENRRDSSNSNTRIKCDYCKKKGHRATECYKKLKADKENSNATKELFLADESTHAPADQKWCLDSGCTSHLCKDSESFTNARQVKDGITLASDTTVPATAKGDVEITISNVDKEHQVLFTKNHAYVRNVSENVKMIANRVGDLFYLRESQDRGRWVEVYFLKNKSEVRSKFLEYKNYTETQTGRKIKTLQSDNGKVFCNAEMKDILKRLGIRRRLSTPYTPPTERGRGTTLPRYSTLTVTWYTSLDMRTDCTILKLNAKLNTRQTRCLNRRSKIRYDCRMGHLNTKDLVGAAKTGIIKGVKLTKSDAELICNLCIQGKMSRVSFPELF
ncbi:hypothetical protein KM043_013366 [Ampulex compressa]|nr:hypothetical protein KM043_013366 [Ampulex compressa]